MGDTLEQRLSRLNDAGLRCRLRSALTGLRSRSLALLAGTLPASPSRDETQSVRWTAAEERLPSGDRGRRRRSRAM